MLNNFTIHLIKSKINAFIDCNFTFFNTPHTHIIVNILIYLLYKYNELVCFNS